MAFGGEAFPVKEHKFSFVGIDCKAEPAQPGKKKGSRSS
jgi:hypothetical protein